MRFYTNEECNTWLSDRQRRKPDLMPDVHVERIQYPPEPYRVFFVAHRVASVFTYRMPTLLSITEWGIWPSSENWHLYYKLRQTYGDNRLLHDAPGHLFLEHPRSGRPGILPSTFHAERLGRLRFDGSKLRERVFQS